MTEVMHRAVPDQTRQKDSENTSAGKVRFKNPPANELMLAVTFSPPLFSLRSEHIGLFWQRIREDFPKVEHRSTINDTPIYGPGEAYNFPMPRYWFISKDGNEVLQLQKNVFTLNSRSHDSNHLRFEDHVKPMFDKYLAVLMNFVAEEIKAAAPMVYLCELSRSYQIKKCEYWSGPADTSSIIPSFCFPGLSDRRNMQSSSECKFAARLDNEKMLQVAIKEASLIENPEDPILSIDVTVEGPPNNHALEEVDSWFSRAHYAAANHFLSMTNPEIRQTLGIGE